MSAFVNLRRVSAAAFLLFLAACGSNEQKSSTETSTTDSTAVEPMPAAPASTISTAPENMVLVMHKVADYAKWKMAYDGDDSNRLANGLHSYVIGRGVDDSNMVFIAMKSDDLTKAKGFASSPTVKAAMKKGGVMGMPKLMFVTTTFQDTAKIDSRLRSMVSISFKNWDTWQRSFDSTKEIRTNNGLADRVVAKVPNDSTKAVLVMAVLDTAKAFAYWKSDQLKEIRKAGGIMGMPERFNFIVVQRY